MEYIAIIALAVAYIAVAGLLKIVQEDYSKMSQRDSDLVKQASNK